MNDNGWPFAGVCCERPYPSSRLTTARWIAEVALEKVFFRQLTLTQTGVDIQRLFNEVKLDDKADDYCHVVVYEDVMYLEDGHHRCCREAIRNPEGSLIMRVHRIS